MPEDDNSYCMVYDDGETIRYSRGREKEHQSGVLMMATLSRLKENGKLGITSGYRESGVLHWYCMYICI